MTRKHYNTSIYGGWISTLVVLIAAAAWCYLRQLDVGLGLTGMSRNVSWGLYIGQFTFADGLAASAVLLFLPYYSGKSTLYGSFVAIAGVIACMLFIVADMGRPSLLLNVLRYASPHSLMFWDMLSLNGFLALNAVIAAVTLSAAYKDVAPPRWLRTVILISIPWAIAMQTVSALLYCGLPGRSLWLTAILAPRFIASACASGPALLIVLQLVIKSGASSHRLRKLVLYALAVNVFFIILEVFVALYSGIPEPLEHFHAVAPWLSVSVLLAVVSLALLRNGKHLVLGCATAFASVWIDKGLGMIIGGFVPSPTGTVTEYLPTAPEITIAAGIWAAGALIATLLFRTAMTVQSYTRESSDSILLEQEVLQ